MRLSPFSRRLWHDEAGTTVMEFGIIAVVFVTMMVGMFDVGQTMYVQSILNGAAQQAARTSSLETGDTATADAELTSLVRAVAPGATVNTTRVSYFDFADIERSESWSDDNTNSVCDNGEAYTDENGNGIWDADIGTSGNGGAGDVVLYTVAVTYDPLFPIPFYDNAGATRSLTARAVRKNQPFADQANYGATAGTCT